MSESEILSGRTEKADVFLPFTPELNQMYDTQPTFRILIDVSESSSMGQLQQGYYVKFNESVYFVRKKYIHVFTNSQTERVLQFLKKTQAQFTVDVRRDETNSGHQYVQFNDVSFNSGIYTVRDYNVYRSLWQLIEGELYENNYSPSIVRFTDSRLVWYAKLMPENSLTFTQVGKIRLNYLDSQGHLEIYRVEKEGDFVLPIYLFSERENLLFFNHEIHQTVDVIPLGLERRIIATNNDIEITSEDHEPITLQAGQYLLFHPRPRPRDGVD
jgi:hypothetical protein